MKYYNNLICKALQNSFGKTFYESSKILPFMSFGTSVLGVPKPELESMSTICKVMNIHADFRIFVNASHSMFLKKREKLKYK